MDNTKQRKIGVIFSYITIVLNVVTGLLYTPVMLRLLGQNEYGLYGTVSSFVGLLTLLDAGLSSSYIRFYSKYKAQNREDKIKSFNALYFKVFATIAAIAFVIGLFFSFNSSLIFDNGLTADEYSKAKIMMIMLTCNTSLGFLSAVFSCYISAHERFVFLKGIGIVNSIAVVCVNLLVLKLGYGAIGLISVSLVSSFIMKAINIYICFKKLNMKFSFSNIEKGLFKSVFAFSGLIAINMIVDSINQGIDSILLGRFCGTAVVAVYSVGASVNSYFVSFSTAISGVFAPYVHSLVNSYETDSEEQKKAITAFFVKVGRIQFMLLSLILSGFVFFGKPFIQLWAGDGYEQSYIIALMLMIPGIIPLSQNVGIEVQRAFNRHKYRAVIYVIMAMVNLIISIILCQHFGGIGSAAGTAIACIVANIVIMNIVYNKKININIIDYWKSILRCLLGMIIPFAFGTAIMLLVDLNNLVNLIIFILIYSVLFCFCIYFMSFNDYEKKLVKGVILKIKKRVK